uniref:(northern house mosquito) hypothetical protein n=1 Tax=Culex pipiens TaxID=7175 RepID=A0A8D8CPK8_CULPI
MKPPDVRIRGPFRQAVHRPVHVDSFQRETLQILQRADCLKQAGSTLEEVPLEVDRADVPRVDHVPEQAVPRDAHSGERYLAQVVVDVAPEIYLKVVESARTSDRQAFHGEQDRWQGGGHFA